MKDLPAKEVEHLGFLRLWNQATVVVYYGRSPEGVRWYFHAYAYVRKSLLIDLRDGQTALKARHQRFLK